MLEDAPLLSVVSRWATRVRRRTSSSFLSTLYSHSRPARRQVPQRGTCLSHLRFCLRQYRQVWRGRRELSMEYKCRMLIEYCDKKGTWRSLEFSISFMYPSNWRAILAVMRPHCRSSMVEQTLLAVSDDSLKVPRKLHTSQNKFYCKYICVEDSYILLAKDNTPPTKFVAALGWNSPCSTINFGIFGISTAIPLS